MVNIATCGIGCLGNLGVILHDKDLLSLICSQVTVFNHNIHHTCSLTVIGHDNSPGLTVFIVAFGQLISTCSLYSTFVSAIGMNLVLGNNKSVVFKQENSLGLSLVLILLGPTIPRCYFLIGKSLRKESLFASSFFVFLVINKPFLLFTRSIGKAQH